MFTRYSRIPEIDEQPKRSNIVSSEVYRISSKNAPISQAATAGIVDDPKKQQLTRRRYYIDDNGETANFVVASGATYVVPGAGVFYPDVFDTYSAIITSGFLVIPDVAARSQGLWVYRYEHNKYGVISAVHALATALDKKHIIAGHPIESKTITGGQEYKSLYKLVSGSDKLVIPFSVSSTGTVHVNLAWLTENCPSGVVVTIKDSTNTVVNSITVTPEESNKNSNLDFSPIWNMKYLDIINVPADFVLGSAGDYTLELSLADTTDAFVYISHELLLWPANHIENATGKFHAVGTYCDYRVYVADKGPFVPNTVTIDFGADSVSSYYFNNITGRLFVPASEANSDQYSYSGQWAYKLRAKLTQEGKNLLYEPKVEDDKNIGYL